MRAKLKPVYVVLLIAVCLLLAGCFGPRPVVLESSLEPPPAGSSEPYHVEVVLSNAGPGGGEVQLIVDLANRRTGEIIAQEMREVDLQKDQTMRISVELSLPPSLQDLAPGDIDLRVDAHYPIE